MKKLIRLFLVAAIAFTTNHSFAQAFDDGKNLNISWFWIPCYFGYNKQYAKLPK